MNTPEVTHAAQPTPVVLAVEHALLREGLVRIIRDEQRLRLAGQATDDGGALRLLAELGSVVVVVEPGLPKQGAVALADEVRARYPLARIVIVSLTEDDALLLAAMRAGVRGLLGPSADAEQLLDCLLAVAAGELFVPPRLAGRLLEKYAALDASGAPEPRPRPGGLTERELDVLELLAAGQTNRQIAERLVITENTVRTHLRSMMQKLNVRNRVQLAAYALTNGLAGRPPDHSLRSTV